MLTGNQPSVFSLNGKTLLITGASSGIGRSIALLTAAEGASVILTGRNLMKLQEVKSTVKKSEIFAADLTMDEEIEKLAEFTPELNGLVLNAGMLKTIPAGFLKRETIQDIFDVNFIGSALLLKHLLKQKKFAKGASVCFISSIASEFVHPGNSIYSASKGAVNSFTRSLALELAPKNIRVNAIQPGLINTSLIENSHIGADELESHLQNYPLGRYGQPEDVANLVIYLMSDASSWMTGSLLKLDGGYSLK